MTRRHWIVPLIVAAQLAWLSWWLTAPMPHIGNIGGGLRRWMLLVGVDAQAGKVVEAIGQAANLVDRLPIVLSAALVGAAAEALGTLALAALGLRRSLRPAERLPIAACLGATGLAVTALGLGRLGLLDPWPTRLGLGALIAAGAAVRLVARRPVHATPPSPPIAWAYALPALPFLALAALGAMQPTIEFDALEYHLQGPKEHFLTGRVGFLPYNVYANMPATVEMLHLLAMTVLGDWRDGALAGGLLVAAAAPLAGLAVAGVASRWGSPRAAGIAALVYLTTPWIVHVAAVPFVEGPLCLFHAALMAVAAGAWAEPDGRLAARRWLLAGLLAGGAFGCKYPALVTAVIPFTAWAVVDARRRRSWRPALAYFIGVGTTAGPWLSKGLIDAGNPVYPLAWRVFGGWRWDADREAAWTAAHGPRPATPATLALAALDVAGRSDWQSPLYLAWGPLAGLRPRSRRPAFWLACYILYIFASWFFLTHRLDRFWLPLLPAAALLAGLGADWTAGRAWSAALALIGGLSLTTALALCATPLVGPDSWAAPLARLRDEVPAEVNPALARLDATLPPGSKVLLVGQAAAFYLGHPAVYATVFDPEPFTLLARDRTPSEIAAELSRLGITHVYVDWPEIARYRSPGNYGFSPFVTPDRLDALASSGVLSPLPPPGLGRSLYRVVGTRASGLER